MGRIPGWKNFGKTLAGCTLDDFRLFHAFDDYLLDIQSRLQIHLSSWQHDA
jgi:hypothetical protein